MKKPKIISAHYLHDKSLALFWSCGSNSINEIYCSNDPDDNFVKIAETNSDCIRIKDVTYKYVMIKSRLNDSVKESNIEEIE